MVEFDFRDHQMIEASETEIAQFAVVVLEGSVAVTTVAMADHVMIDLLDHGIHGRRTCHSSASAANRRLPLIGDCLPADQLRETFLLPTEGVEPTRPCGHWILSPARLPIPPRRLIGKTT
jgi:hypothetical protein